MIKYLLQTYIFHLFHFIILTNCRKNRTSRNVQLTTRYSIFHSIFRSSLNSRNNENKIENQNFKKNETQKHSNRVKKIEI